MTAQPFRQLDLDVVVAASGDEALRLADKQAPALAILDAEMPNLSGYQVSQRLKENSDTCRVVLVMGKRIQPEQMRRVAESRCDEVLIAPMSADELYDVVAIQLCLPRRGAEKFSIEIAQPTPTGTHALNGQVSNLSVDGMRLVVAGTPPVPLTEGATLHVTILPNEGNREPMVLAAHVVWAEESNGEITVGAAFDDISDEARVRLGQLTQWEVVEDTERTRLVIKGDITEATNFDGLLPLMVGRVDFDLSQIRYMNSLGVGSWVKFLRDAKAQGYEFHACSSPFVYQASMVTGVLGRGTVASFFAPYHCEGCDREEEKLLQSAAVLAANYEPPTFTCPDCGDEMYLDEIPDRYLAFLRPGPSDDEE